MLTKQYNRFSEVTRLPISPAEVVAKIAGKKFRTDEIILASSFHSSRNIDLSLRLAIAMSLKKSGVLYLNTMIRHEAIMRKTLDLIKGQKLGNPNISFLSFLSADLALQGELLRNHIIEHNIKVIVLNSWEYASMKSSDKRDLSFMLKSLWNEFELCMVVFTQERPENIQPNKIKRGSIGFFAGLADSMVDFNQPSTVFDDLFSTLGGQNEELRPILEEPKVSRPEPAHTSAAPIESSGIKDIAPTIQINDLAEGRHLIGLTEDLVMA